MEDSILPFYAGIILDIVSASEVFIIIPVFVAKRAEATALEVLLNKVDDILDCKRLQLEAPLSLNLNPPGNQGRLCSFGSVPMTIPSPGTQSACGDK